MKRVLVCLVALMMLGSIAQAGINVELRTATSTPPSEYSGKEYYLITAPGLWEMKMGKGSFIIFSFKDLTDPGAAAYSYRHQNYQGENPTTGAAPAYNFQHGLFEFVGRNKTIGQSYANDTATSTRFSYSATGTNLDYFEATYTESAGETPAYLFDAYSATGTLATTHGQLLSTVKMRIYAPTASFTRITMILDCVNQTTDAKSSNIFSGGGTRVRLRYGQINTDNPQGLNYNDTVKETTAIDGAWNPAAPQSYQKIQIISGTLTDQWGFAPGRTFTLDHVAGRIQTYGTHTNGPAFSTNIWATTRYWNTSTPLQGVNMAASATYHYQADLMINLTVVTIADASATESTVSVDPNAIANNGTATSTVSITLKSSDGQLIKNVPLGQIQVTATDTSGGNIYGTLTEIGNGLYQVTLASTVSEIKTVTVKLDKDADTVFETTLEDTPTVLVYDPNANADATQTVCSISPNVQSTNPGQQSTITVQLKDAFGIPLSGKAAYFTIESTGTGNTIGTLAETATLGTYTTTMSSTVGEAKTLTITYDDPINDPVVLTNTLGITFITPYTPTQAQCVVVNSPNSANIDDAVWANGTSVVTVTMTVKDSYGYPILGIPSSDFTLSTNRDTGSDIWSAVTEVGGGVYTATLACTTATWPDNTPVKVISVDCRSVTITAGTNNCYFQPIRLPDADQSTMSVAKGRMVANGTMTNTVTLNLKDSLGAYIAKYWGSLVLRVDGNPTALTFTDLGGGVYTAQYVTSNTGTQTLSVSFDGTPVTQTQNVLASSSMPLLYFQANTPSAGYLTITARESDNTLSYWKMVIGETNNPGKIMQFYDLRGLTLAGYGSPTMDLSHQYDSDPKFFNPANTDVKVYTAGTKVDGSTSYTFTVTSGTNVVTTSQITINAPDFAGSLIESTNTYVNPSVDTNRQARQQPQSNLRDVATTIGSSPGISYSTVMVAQDIWTSEIVKAANGSPGEFSDVAVTATVKTSQEALTAGFLPGLSFELTSFNVFSYPYNTAQSVLITGRGGPDRQLSMDQGAVDNSVADYAMLAPSTSVVRETTMFINIAARADTAAGAVDAAQCDVAAAPTTQGANGIDEIVVTVQLKDAGGNPVMGQANKLVLTSTGTGNAITVFTEGAAYGTYQAAITSTVAEAKTLTVTFDGSTVLANDVAVEFVATGTASAATSYVLYAPEATAYACWANGLSHMTFAMVVKDAAGYALTGLTAADFTLSTDLPTGDVWGPVVEVAPGIYRTTLGCTTTNYDSGTSTWTTKIFTIACQGETLPRFTYAGNAAAGNCYFKPVTDTVPVVAQSTVVADKTVAQANGTDTVTITVTIKNTAGIELNGLASYITVSQDGTGTTLSAVTEVSPCVYQATLTGTAIELVTIGAGFNDGVTSFTLTQTPKVQFYVADYANLATCTNTASPTTGIEANGLAFSTITIVMKNHAGLAITGLTAADFTITDPYGDPVAGAAFTAITETATPGTYTTIMTGSTTGTKDVMIGYIFSAEETQYLDPYMSITFTDPIPADAWYSRVVNTGAHVIPADGTTTAAVTITLRDTQAAHNLIANALALGRLTVTVDGTNVTGSVTESSPGVYTFTYASDVASIKPVVVTYNDGVNPAVVLDDLELYFQITTPLAKLVYSGDDISAYCTPAQRAYLIIPAAEIANVAGLVTIEGNGGSFEYDFGAAGSQTAASIVTAISTNEDATLVEAYEASGAVYMRSFSSGLIDLTDQIRGYSDSAFVKVTLGVGGVCATTDLNGVAATQDFGVSPKTRIVRCVNISDPTDIRWELHVTRNGNDFIFSHFYDMTDAGLPGGGHFDYVGRQGDRYGRATGLFRVHTMSDTEFNPAQPTAASLITESETELKFQVENGGTPLSFMTVYTVRPSTNLGGTITAARTLTNVTAAAVDLNVVAGAIQAMNSASYLGVGPYNGRAYNETTNPLGASGIRPFYDASLYRYQYTAGDDHAFGTAANDDDGNGTVDDATEAGYGDDQLALWKFTDMLDRTNHAIVDAAGTGLVNFPWPAGTTVDPYQMMWSDAEIMVSDAATSQGLVAGRSFAMGTDIVGYYPGGDSTFGDIRMGGTAAAYWDGFVMENVNREWWGTARGSYMVAAGGTVTKNFMLVWNIDQGEGAPVPELAMSASLDYSWVYPNTPVTTQNRHKSVLSVSITSGKVDGETYAITVGENGGAVTNFQVTQPVDISSGSATVDVLGGLRTTAVPGTYTLNVTVTGATLSQVATQDVTLKLRLLGDIVEDDIVNASDKLEMNKKLNGLENLAGITLRDLDLSGDGALVNAEDKLAINQILNGLIVP